MSVGILKVLTASLAMALPSLTLAGSGSWNCRNTDLEVSTVTTISAVLSGLVENGRSVAMKVTNLPERTVATGAPSQHPL